MNRRMKAVLLAAGLTAATAVASLVVLTAAFAKVMDPQNYCETGFSKLIDCTYHRTSTITGKSTPIFANPSDAASANSSEARDTPRLLYADVTAWAVVDCPTNTIARRLLCAATSDAAPVQAASDDATTGLPRPKPWFVTTAKDSTFIKAFHVETPRDLAGVLGFYRRELSKRGWSENGGAVVAPGRAVVAFTTPDGPALLRLTRQGDRTIADLSLRKPAATTVGLLPMPGQARLLLGNSTDDEASITINGQTIKLEADTKLADNPFTERKSSDSLDINLPPGKYKVTLKVASGAVQNRELELAADETWGLVAGPAGVPLPLHIY
jgi:hypothetical protein